MKKINVLMLGWEFPPVVNGGLGIACLGLAKALSAIVNLSIIVPQASTEYLIEQMELIGLNQIDLQKLKTDLAAREVSVQTNFSDESIESISFIPVDFYPYENVSSEQQAVINKSIKSTVTENYIPKPSVTAEDLATFSGDLYGDDIWTKIQQYANVASKVASTKHFDVIHAHDWMTFAAGLQIKHESGKPLVLHIHSLETDRAGIGSRGGVFQLEQHAMNHADLIIPVSNYTASVIQHHYGINASKVAPVHNGVEKVETFKTEKPFPEKLVLFLGRLTGQKGPSYFLEIAHKVLQNYPNVRFVVAGTGDKLKGLIETSAYKQIGSRIHFTGFLDREKVYELLSMADVYCMPSVSEPFGISALEAAQFGVPCVISNQSGVAEVLPSALTADFWDISLMARNIFSLLKDEKLTNEVVTNTLKDLDNISWEHAAEQIVTLYQSRLGL